MQSTITRFFGGPPAWVLLRLALVSLLVGLVFSLLDIRPADIYYWTQDLVRHIYYMGFEAFADLFRYFLLGAAVVFPVWLVLRLMKLLGGQRQPPSDTRNA